MPYWASYDALWDMPCRAPTSTTTCSGSSPMGQQLQYDAERRLAHWQSSPSSPTSSADYLYDGSGNRVEQVQTVGSTSTRVYYLLGGAEEVATTGSTSTLTKYYSAAGLLIGVNVGDTISYLASDGLGSVSEAFDGAGTVTAAQLYGPYGGVRYSSGVMPTSKGFTGQRSDAATSGLDYYNARYYDPVIGQFASADTQEGPNRYAYVRDDPETLTDPTGHRRTCSTGDCDPPPPPPGKNPPPTRDKNGKCADWNTCDSDQTKTAKKVRQQADDDARNGALLIIIGKLIAAGFALAAKNLDAAIDDALEAFGWIDKYLVPIFQGLFGRDSAAAHLAGLAVSAVNLLAAGIHMWYGVAFMAGALMTALTTVFEGPLNAVITIGSIVLGGLLNMGVGYGFYLVNRSMEEYDQADQIAYEPTPEWCDSSGACGANWQTQP